MFDKIMLLAMFLLSISLIITLYRIIKGPTIHDRILALDSIAYIIIGIVAILSIHLNSHAYFETILLIGILAFLSTIALSRYMERGVVIGRKRSD
ncbi:MAG: Na(+)/H(+) antiporter subunit F1 [Candidatus Pristimantibacillus lignocellulolyticus]|uniref:Na(+)/H(+) antiporter subunit F1 n=1 Tax=Candidatus Pristimantibacillus lignocellulolyticus TaxID=2994561 RepID=A0A9J6ZLC5_9BACL|nr:MAG: Na(+)/H(+) antiporter subunit F1 [Candidatus Pristimantibacillus lignocellulolyticus]